MKSDVSLSAHPLRGPSLASPKKNSKSYQDQGRILTVIVWVAKGHCVAIVQKLKYILIKLQLYTIWESLKLKSVASSVNKYRKANSVLKYN